MAKDKTASSDPSPASKAPISVSKVAKKEEVGPAVVTSEQRVIARNMIQKYIKLRRSDANEVTQHLSNAEIASLAGCDDCAKAAVMARKVTPAEWQPVVKKQSKMDDPGEV